MSDKAENDVIQIEQAKVSLSNLVIYNRVPKCGSTTMDKIIDKLEKMNKFNAVNDIAPGLKVSLLLNKTIV